MKTFINKILSIDSIIYLYIITLLAISFLPIALAQIGNNQIITPFNGFEFQTFDEFIQIWHKSYLGMYTVLFTPQLLIAFVLYKIFPPIIANVLYVGGIKFLAGISIFILLRNFTKNKSICLLGSLFYLLSIYGQAIIENTPSGGYLFYAVLPLLFHLFITINRQNAAKNLIIYAVLLLLITDTNFTYIVYLFILLFSYAAYCFLFLKERAWLFYFSLFAILFIFVNQYYYLPLLMYNTIYQSNILGSNLQAESAGWKGSFSSPAEVIRLMGSLDFYNKYSIGSIDLYARPFFLYFIQKPLILILSFIPSLIAIAGLSLTAVSKAKRYIRNEFYLLLFILFFFFSVGAHFANPFKEAYEFLSKQFLLFAIFRDPYKSVLILNLLLSLGIVFFFKNESNNKRRIQVAGSFFVLVLFILSLSYLRGGVFEKSELMKVPPYTYDLAKWNESSHEVAESKKLLFPHQPFPILNFANYPGKGGPIYYQILNSTAVQGNAQFTPYIDQMQSLILDPKFEQIAGFYNIPYVIVSKDLNYEIYKTISPDIISTHSAENLQKVIGFGPESNIDVYKINMNNLNHEVYIPERLVIATTGATLNNFIDLNQIFSTQNDNKFAIVEKNDASRVALSIDKASLPNVSVIRKSNTLFDISISNFRGDFMLVFNESYNKGWVIRSEDNPFFEIPFFHIPVNGFGNGYWIDKKTVSKYLVNGHKTNTFTFQLYFMPQLYFYLGLGISGLTLLCLLIYFIHWRVKKSV